MRRELLRLVSIAVLTSTSIVCLPVLLLALYRLVHPGTILPGAYGVDRPWMLVGILVALSVIAGSVAMLIADRRVGQLVRALTALAVQAESIGKDGGAKTPAKSGIAEVDRVAEAIRRSDLELARVLTAERQFVSDASHQMRTPLTALQLRLDELTTLDSMDDVREEAEGAIAQVERMTKVIEDLRARTAPSHDQGPRDASLDAVLAAIQRDWQMTFERARRSVRVRGERGLNVRASASMLNQILATLLENSLKHGAGTVEVVVRRSGPSIVIEVSDHGAGVDPSIAPHIFERSVTSGKGTGLGLGVARGLAEACGGRLELVRARPAAFAIFLSEAGIH